MSRCFSTLALFASKLLFTIGESAVILSTPYSFRHLLVLRTACKKYVEHNHSYRKHSESLKYDKILWIYRFISPINNRNNIKIRVQGYKASTHLIMSFSQFKSEEGFQNIILWNILLYFLTCTDCLRTSVEVHRRHTYIITWICFNSSGFDASPFKLILALTK